MLLSGVGMKECVFCDAETGESRPVFSAPRRGRPTAQVPAHLLSISQSLQTDGSLTLTVKGQLDLNTVLSFRDAVFSALGERPSRLTLDLSPLLMVEAVGISTLVTLIRVAQLVNIPCQLIPSESLQSLLLETGLVRLMEIPPTNTDRPNSTFLLS